MQRRYPKDENVKRLLCEHVRLELHRKFTLIGLYAGDKIVFHPVVPGKYPYILAGLAFVFIMKDGLGEFEAHFTLLDPDHKAISEVNLTPVNFKLDGTNGVVIQLNSVQFNSEGIYTAVLRLEKKKYNFPIVISSAAATESK